ncbi:Putative alkane-1-monooxygenase AlkB (fatty acid omega-hydroxylase) [Mycobacteroides abscessus]|nr:Putative alkane-1-monooxygenase AlkB (fatty acid omega-hydroxylase) [Mycobacteroides abscessus]
MTSNLETGPAQPAAQWRDRKRYMWLYGMIPPTAIFIATALVYAMNQLGWQQFSPIFFWIGPLLVYVILPLLDLNFGADGENAGVIVLRRSRPDLPRSFRTPGVPWLPIVAIVACGWLMLNLAVRTWLFALSWMVIGVIVYFAYSRKHSVLGLRVDVEQ